MGAAVRESINELLVSGKSSDTGKPQPKNEALRSTFRLYLGSSIATQFFKHLSSSKQLHLRGPLRLWNWDPPLISVQTPLLYSASSATPYLPRSSAKKQNIFKNDSQVSSYMSLKLMHLFDPNSEPISPCEDLSGPWSWYEYYLIN